MNALTVARKEWQLLLKDRGSLVVLFVFPVMFAIIIGSAFTSGTPQIGVLLVNQDEGAYGAQVVETLRGIDALRLTELDTPAEADARVANGSALAAVLIPADFSRQVDAHEPTGIAVMVDPTQQQYGSIVTGMMQEVVAPIRLQGEVQHGIRLATGGAGDAALTEAVMGRLQAALANPPIAVSLETLEGVRLTGFRSAYQFSFPAYAIMFAFFIMSTIAETILNEKETGAFRRLLAAPISKASIIGGKLLAYMAVLVAQMALVLGVGRLAFQIPLGHAPLGLLVVTLALAFTACALAMLIVAVGRTRTQIQAFSFILAFLLAALGGVVIQFPPDSLLTTVSKLTPHAHAMAAYQALMVDGGTLTTVLPQVGLLAAVGAVFFIIAMWRFRFES